MCGIAGAFSFDGSPFEITAPYITRLRDASAHRGPDGAGTWVSDDRRVGLGHRRLSIIDLSPAASQPMSNAAGTLRISYNGEIYNHAEIRAQLLREGVSDWKTDHSDTEVILKAFERWGIDCLHRFRGMFAIALWDERTRELWLIRDRIGIKPLYYSIHHGRLTFASEIKALLQDPEQKRAINETGFFHYLSFLTVPAPETLFDGIHKLPGGCWLRVRQNGETREQRYWDLGGQPNPLIGAGDEEIARRLLAELRTSVQLHGVSDVPVGVFLSGGIDSSTIAALFSERRPKRLKTFSIGYGEGIKDYPSELPYARRMAERIGSEHHEKILAVDDLIEFLPRMIQLQDEPIADPVCVPVYYLSKLARENGVPVCQVGEGSDELFWGYPAWKDALERQRRSEGILSRLLARLRMVRARQYGRDENKRYELLRRSANGQPLFWGGFDEFTQAQKMALLSPRLSRRFRAFTSWEAIRPIRERFDALARDHSPLNWMSYVDLNMRLPELLLMRVDKMSMGVGLEGRVPFLDHVLVELAMNIPEQVKTRGGNLKGILKRAVRGVIPDEIIDRKKQGFGVPVNEWFQGRLGEAARVEIDAFCRETDLLDPAEVTRLRDRGKGRRLWFLFNLALWWKEFLR